MRDFISRHVGVFLYFIRIPTRFAMIYLGAKSAPLYDVVYVLMISLCLVAWAKNAPITLLKPRKDCPPNSGWLDRLNRPLALVFSKHIAAALLMTVVFYAFGKNVFFE